MPSAIVPESNVQVQTAAGGAATVLLRGQLDADATTRVWRYLERTLPPGGYSTLEVDASQLERCEGSGIALLHHLSMGSMTPGAKVKVRGLKDEFQRLYQGFTVEDYQQYRPQPEPKSHVAQEVGVTVRHVLRDMREQIEFMGSITTAFGKVLFNRKRMRWPEVKRVFETAGANGLPIVSLISILVGLIIAFESAQPLAEFGAQLYIANMIGLLMVRELGPLMTSILFAGRSGSAFAAELGTMKVNEELNALETMGLDPIRFLVVQRIMAAMLLMPLLTIYSMFMGVLGGVVVMHFLGFPLTLIYNQLISSFDVGDILLGITKGTVFGVIVASVGCLRGLQTQKGPSAVGESTTRAVVSSILLIIIADAIFSMIIFAFD